MSSIASTSSIRCATSSAVEAHVERTEGDLVAHRRREDLRVGVLEHETDPRAEASSNLLVLEGVLGDLVPERLERARRRGTRSPSSTLSNVDFPHAVRPEQRDPSRPADRERHVVERREPAEVRVADAVDARARSR